jgi:malonyl-CoA decarboxylase
MAANEPYDRDGAKPNTSHRLAGSRAFIARLLSARQRLKIDARVRADRRKSGQLVATCRSLLSETGEVSGARMAAEAVAAYKALSVEERGRFFDQLVSEFSPAPAIVYEAAAAYREVPSVGNLAKLQRVVEPRRQELFRRLNMAPGGTGLLVLMRQQVMESIDGHEEWRAIGADLEHLFHSWFNRGFLTLQRIDWRTSATVLERLIEYEAVHQIKGWDDLRRRLAEDRRCYGFFHPALPDEPLIFIEVALADGIVASVQQILDLKGQVTDPHAAKAAIFYSITNCQAGLRGISFGNLLIKQVVEDLGKSLPGLKVFSTLSPIPGFRQWLLAGEAGLVVSEGVRAALVHTESAHLPDSVTALAGIREELTRLCAYYLVRAKSGTRPVDPVARFHLANGARLERINWAGDVSDAGMSRSFGFTANYVYRLADLEMNHESYVKDNLVVSAPRLWRLAQSAVSRDRLRTSSDAREAARFDREDRRRL